MKRARRDPDERVEVLAAERDRWLAFLRQRMGSTAEAEDILQDSLVRALEGVGKVRREEDLFAWFYRVLRHAVVDTYRRRAAVSRRDERLTADFVASVESNLRAGESREAVCACIRPRLAELNPRYARLLEAVDLEGQPAATAAAEEGVSPGSVHVTLHRARQALRRELVRFCGACAENACLDCGCESPLPDKKSDGQV